MTVKQEEMTIKQEEDVTSNEFPYPCGPCGYISLSSKEFNFHIDNCPGHNLNCKMCNDVYETKKLLKYHVKNFHFNGKKKLYKKEPKIPKNRETFTKTVESDKKIIYPCGQCEHVSTTNIEFNYHIKNASDHEPICMKCKLTYANIKSLQDHVRKYHFNLATVTCKDCGKVSNSQEQHNQHWR